MEMTLRSAPEKGVSVTGGLSEIKVPPSPSTPPTTTASRTHALKPSGLVTQDRDAMVAQSPTEVRRTFNPRFLLCATKHLPNNSLRAPAA
ncbi:hypothetical protein J6590_052132 [Homalodisca vitripennis]|nr:hypothetical protein J6590_052132 [Homalodisca vitripennis]